MTAIFQKMIPNVDINYFFHQYRPYIYGFYPKSVIFQGCGEKENDIEILYKGPSAG